MMKILYVLEHYHPYIGGSERLFQDLAEKLSQEGHQVYVITSRFDRALPRHEVINKVKVVRIGSNRFWFTILSIPSILQYAQKVDIIHTTTYNAALPTWIATRFIRKKVILTFHEVWGRLWFNLPYASFWERTAFYSFEKLVLTLPFDHYIAVSRYTQDSLIRSGIKKERISQIYNGLDYSEFESYSYRPPIAPPFQLVYFGRLGISKGIDLIVEAMAHLKREGYPVQLTMIVPTSPKSMWKRINQAIDSAQVRDLITFKHNMEREELFQFITGCHAVLVPSYSEGFCFTAVESATLGIPVIHSGKGALREVMPNPGFQEMTGTALAKAVRKVLIFGNNEPGPVPVSKRFPLDETTKASILVYKKIGIDHRPTPQ
jgi:glycosyltransferase involved in cell wall biosynthesis